MTDTPLAGGRPSPDLAIVETRVYRGANVWSYEKSIHLVVDLGSLEQFPTNTIPGFTDNLLQMLPGLREHSCSRGRRDWSLATGNAARTSSAFCRSRQTPRPWFPSSGLQTTG